MAFQGARRGHTETRNLLVRNGKTNRDFFGPRMNRVGPDPLSPSCPPLCCGFSRVSGSDSRIPVTGRWVAIVLNSQDHRGTRGADRDASRPFIL